MKKRLKIFLSFFAIILVSDLFVMSSQPFSDFRILTKPLLLISLLLFYGFNSRHLKWETRLITILALSLSLIGDMLLLFDSMAMGFFIAGLISFLLSHICYIIIFSKDRHPKKYKYLFLVLLASYAIIFFRIIQPGLNEMLIPVILYMLVILGMLSTAFLRRNDPTLSYSLVLVGALFFVISDSLLAYDKFLVQFKNANLYIMLTYALAQVCIVVGLIYSRRISFIRQIQDE